MTKYVEVVVGRLNGLIETASAHSLWEQEAAAEMRKAVDLLSHEAGMQEPVACEVLKQFIDAFDKGAVEINSAEIDPGDEQQPYPWHEEWISRARAAIYAAPASHGAMRDALFEPETLHAGWNLESALYDIRRLSEAGKPTDAVCIRTIERVCKQLFKAEAALATIREDREGVQSSTAQAGAPIGHLRAALEECASRCRYDGDGHHDRGDIPRRDASWKAADMACAALASLPADESAKS